MRKSRVACSPRSRCWRSPWRAPRSSPSTGTASRCRCREARSTSTCGRARRCRRSRATLRDAGVLAASVCADVARACEARRSRDQGGQLRARTRHHAARAAREADAGRRHADGGDDRRGHDVRRGAARAPRDARRRPRRRRPAGCRAAETPRRDRDERRGPRFSGHVFPRDGQQRPRAAAAGVPGAACAARRRVGATRARPAVRDAVRGADPRVDRREGNRRSRTIGR